MAETPFIARIDNSNSYTVPSGKRAIFQAISPDVGIIWRINGIGLASGTIDQGASLSDCDALCRIAGLTAKAGDVIDYVSGTGGVTLVGMLYDN